MSEMKPQFNKPGERTFVSPSGSPIVGTVELLTGVSMLSGIDKNGEPDYAGDTEIDWNAQRSVRNHGRRVYVDENGDHWTLDSFAPDLAAKERLSPDVAHAVTDDLLVVTLDKTQRELILAALTSYHQQGLVAATLYRQNDTPNDADTAASLERDGVDIAALIKAFDDEPANGPEMNDGPAP